MNTIMTPRVILASSSPFRRALLESLRMPFTCISPDVDESPSSGEQPEALVIRLSRQKAAAVAAACSEAALVIGSDQTACLDGEMLGKPGTTEQARRQLQRMRGRQVEFLTGLCVLHTQDALEQADLARVSVRFRNITDTEIDRYIALDEPLNCAGSFRSESLGISLVEAIHSDDPTALVGLPLIRLCEILRTAGLHVP